MKRRRNLVISTVAIVLVALLVNVFDLPVRDQFGRALNPIGSATNSLAQSAQRKTEDWFGPADSKSIKTNQELTQLKIDNIELERLRRQNRQLRQELNFVRDSQFETLQADVVTYKSDAARDMIRINAGGEDGIEAGMPVVAESVLVGVIDDTTSFSADVIMITDVGFRALAKVGSKSEGVVSGGPGGSVAIDRLPQEESISTGDIVSTSGRDGTFPADIMVGTVRSIVQEPGAVFDTAQIAPPISYRDLEVVTIIVAP